MFEPVLTTQAQLERAWRELMGPWSFGRHSVWMMLICDDRPLPHLTEIAEAEDPPGPDQVDGLATILLGHELEVAPGLRVAFLRSRPGKDIVTDVDRAWASSLYASARRAGAPARRARSCTSPPVARSGPSPRTSSAFGAGRAGRHVLEADPTTQRPG